MGRFVSVARATDLAPGRALKVEVGGATVALFNVDGKLFALDDMCTHSGGPLSEGEVCDGAVTCPWHGARFDLASGASTGGPASRAARTYAVREFDGRIEVEVP